MQKNRMFLNPGSFAAALTCLVLAACGGPSPSDSGMMPDPDAYMAMDDGGMPMDDAYVPPDHDSGMPDVDAGMDAGEMGTCTSDMMANRVSPPCDPDNNASGAGATQSWFTDHFGFGHAWASPGSSACTTGVGTDDMGLPIVRISCPETDIDPCHGVFHYSADGTFNCNWQNRDLPGPQGNWQEIVLTGTDHTAGNLVIHEGGSSTMTTVPLWEP